jgi:hypothetical protein
LFLFISSKIECKRGTIIYGVCNRNLIYFWKVLMLLYFSVVLFVDFMVSICTHIRNLFKHFYQTQLIKEIGRNIQGLMSISMLFNDLRELLSLISCISCFVVISCCKSCGFSCSLMFSVVVSGKVSSCSEFSSCSI